MKRGFGLPRLSDKCMDGGQGHACGINIWNLHRVLLTSVWGKRSRCIDIASCDRPTAMALNLATERSRTDRSLCLQTIHDC